MTELSARPAPSIAELLRVVVSFVLAADAVSVAIAATGTIALAPIWFVVTGAIGLFVGMPAFFVLRLKWRETWLSCIVAGFLVGAFVVACFVLPGSGAESVQFEREMVVVDGVRTAAGWRMDAGTIGSAGAIGAGAGGVFWAALRVLESGRRWRRLRHLPLIAGISLAVAISWAIFAAARLTADR